MKPRLGDSERDGNLLLGGTGSPRDGASGRILGAYASARRASGSISALSSARTSFGIGPPIRKDVRRGEER